MNYLIMSDFYKLNNLIAEIRNFQINMKYWTKVKGKQRIMFVQMVLKIYFNIPFFS